jgi:hypothetical protein
LEGFVEKLVKKARFMHNNFRVQKLTTTEIRGFYMMNKIRKTELLDQINTLRMKMIQVGLKKGLNSRETIIVSKQLDHLLFTYQLHNFSSKQNLP